MVLQHVDGHTAAKQQNLLSAANKPSTFFTPQPAPSAPSTLLIATTFSGLSATAQERGKCLYLDETQTEPAEEFKTFKIPARKGRAASG